MSETTARRSRRAPRRKLRRCLPWGIWRNGVAWDGDVPAEVQCRIQAVGPKGDMLHDGVAWEWD